MPSAPTRLLQSLRSRSFALLWSGQFTSRFGDSVYQVVLVVWLVKNTGSGGEMASVLAATVAPMVLLGLFGGVVVDRLPRLPLMYAADVARATTAIVLGVSELRGTLDVGEVLAGSVVFGIAQAFFQPAYTAVLPQIMPRASLQQANSLTRLGVEFAQIFGPAIGAVIVAIWSPGVGFIFNGASFVVSMITVAAIGWRRYPRPARTEGSGVFREALDGISTVLREPWLWFTIGLAAVANVTLAGPMRIALPFLLVEERDAGGHAYGILLSCGAGGSIIAAYLVGTRGKLRRRGLLAYGAWMAQGVMLVLFASSLPIPVFWVAAFLGGACLILTDLIWVGTLQEIVPAEKLGRVSAIDQVFSWGLLPIGLVVIGLLRDVSSARTILLTCGAATLLLPALGLLHPRIRRLD